MKKLFLSLVILVGLSSSLVAVDSSSCKYYNYVSGKKICNYSSYNAVRFAKKYWDYKKNNNYNPFGTFPSNCTHFVSQSILSGLIGSYDIDDIYYKRTYYDSDRNDPINWFFINKNDIGNSWSEAHSLYLYAKESEKDIRNLKYNGLKFKKVTRDYISSYFPNSNEIRPNKGALYVDKIQKGDIVFIDYKDINGNYSQQNKPLKEIITDGKMDHSYIVTNIQSWRSGYNEIRVTSNDNNYLNKGLGTINNEYDRKIEFHIYRPLFFVEK